MGACKTCLHHVASPFYYVLLAPCMRKALRTNTDLQTERDHTFRRSDCSIVKSSYRLAIQSPKFNIQQLILTLTLHIWMFTKYPLVN